MNYLKDLFEKYEELKPKMDKLDAEYESNPQDEELEKKWDETYRKYHHTYVELTKAIVRESLGIIDCGTARKLIATKYDDIKAIAIKLV